MRISIAGKQRVGLIIFLEQSIVSSNGADESSITEAIMGYEQENSILMTS
jgi:hypothetical protein